ncbi:hypothetical protein FBU30_009139 [Linnemannia zychae]|nr:hypothetical protein FBU30_009139 [Linnemannia zychae]
MDPGNKSPTFDTLCQLVKELGATDYTHFCNVARAPSKQRGSQLYCRVMTRLLESDNHSAQTAGKAMETFWNSPNRDKIIGDHWATKSSEKSVGRLVTRSATRAVVQVALLNDKLSTVYTDAVLHEANNQLRTPNNSRAKEQSVSVTDTTDDELDADVDAQANRNDIGTSVEADEDADDFVLDELSTHSPFGDLIKDLYALYGHDSTKMKLTTKPRSSPLLNELYAHSKHLLESWREDNPIHQKQLLVALSCIINTIDGDNKSFHAQFDDFKRSCIVKDFMVPTAHQLEFVDRMLHETGFQKTADLDTLDIWSLRHACDLRVSMKRESPLFIVSDIDSMKEELTICSLVHILCDEILRSGNRSCSEQEEVCLWRDVARALYHGDIVPRMGELSSAAVRSDRRRVEGAICRDRTSVQVRGRKIDLFFQLPSEKKPVELFSWEAKTSDAGSLQLQVQRCKNLRLNACMIGTTLSMAGLDRKQSSYPLPSPLLLDIAGRNALPYKIQKINGDVFVAGAVMEDKSLISLPRTKEEMVDFLKEGGLTALLRVKAINDEYAKNIKDGMRKVRKEEAKNRMLGYGSMLETRNPIINTPTKKHNVATPRTPDAKKVRLVRPPPSLSG